MASRAVLIKTGLRPLNNVRTVNTAHLKTTVYSARPMSYFSKLAQSTVKRPYQIRTSLTNKKFNQKANTAKGKFYTARPKAINTTRPNSAVVNAVRENQNQVIDGLVSKETNFIFLLRVIHKKKIKAMLTVDAQSHMTGNMSYLSDFKEFNEGYVTFGGGAKEGKLLNRVLVVKPHNKTLYELFRGRKLALSFMRPFGCHVTILNTLDYLGKLDGKSDEGFCVGYSMNSTNSNDLVDVSLFDSSSKNVSNDEPQPSSDAGKKDDEGVNKESGIIDQEKSENSTKGVNTAGPSINTEPDMFSLGDNAKLEATYTNFFGDEIEVDMRNITTTYPVPSTPNTRIHKDHSLDHVIGDIQSGVLTRRMTKTTNEQGFISTFYEGKTHEDLHTCLFACFLSQEDPEKVIQALKDPSWIEVLSH
ncbi:hypothetical protein Tco_0920376 [Tanacetum coccineum]